MQLQTFRKGEKPFTQSEFRSKLNDMVFAINTLLLNSEQESNDVIDLISTDEIWISITGSTMPGSILAWEYDWKQVIPSVMTHSLVFTELDPPITSSSEGYGPAYNSLESNNPTNLSVAGILPIGVPLPQTGTIQPFGVGAVFSAKLIETDGIAYPIFTGVNSITC